MTVFFLGIGGIGMSALARYYHHKGDRVAGYDRTPSALTKELEDEGIEITYRDALSSVQSLGLTRDDTLVVRTPAVPEDSIIYSYLREQGFTIRKRAEVLGMVTREKKALCVAGTHGKTTTSTMLAHILNGGNGINAFLGGISMNYHTNLLLDSRSEYVVVEADEYDRSFHQLTPYISVVTAVDADHLDIYGTPAAYREAFADYTSLITYALVMKHGIALQPRLNPGVRCYTYGIEEGDYHAADIRIANGQITFDLVTPTGVVKDIVLGVPVWVNIENAIAAMTVALIVGTPMEQVRERVASFKGVWRRFNIHVNTPEVVYIDDYAHHPEEIATAIDSIRKLFPERKLIGVFQPHLYTRTRDFADGFARVLSTMDEVVLLPIYPARELPIEGVDSEMLMARITNPNKRIVEKAELVNYLASRKNEGAVILTVGAGDIDRLVEPIAEELR